MTGSFIGRLARDVRANVLAIGAASILPLIALVGGGIDASRMYLAKARLQQACDSAALAARKKESGRSGAGGLSQEARDTANRFFRTNFTEGMYGSTDLVFNVRADSGSRISGTASVNVPTTLMSVFGKEQVGLTAECSAEFSMSNLDIMLALDMSGSMNNVDQVTGETRIEGLKKAVRAFITDMMASKPAGMQLRIGIMPYADTVNVGKLLVAENPDFIADSHVYQTREALYGPVSNNDGIALGDVIKTETNIELLPIDSDGVLPIQKLGSTTSLDYRWNETVASNATCCTTLYNGVHMVGNQRWTISGATWLSSYWGTKVTKGTRAACQATVMRETLAGEGDVKEPTYSQGFIGSYHYKPMLLDTSRVKLGETVFLPVGTAGAMVEAPWEGCIEERGAIPPGEDRMPVPGALDLDIDTVPDPANPDTQWKVLWGSAARERTRREPEIRTHDFGLPTYVCPQPAMRLQEWPTDPAALEEALDGYLGSMSMGNWTHHDLGLIWSARFLSPTGIFAKDNSHSANGLPIQRHIVLMTDGMPQPAYGQYSAFGEPNTDGRFFGFPPDGGYWKYAVEPHLIYHLMHRVDAACNAIKNRNMTIWVVPYGLSPTSELTRPVRECASGSQRLFAASNNIELTNAFRQIASSFGDLRLVK